ncbi:MAG: hypothetical protein LLG02_08740 [Pelosinus sp.]|nr:hypothetical protein [Pelosinus sp.]
MLLCGVTIIIILLATETTANVTNFTVVLPVIVRAAVMVILHGITIQCHIILGLVGRIRTGMVTAGLTLNRRLTLTTNLPSFIIKCIKVLYKKL